jgi:hypothetical protein
MVQSITANNRSIFSSLTRFFSEDDWKFRQIEGKPVIELGYQGENASYKCLAIAYEDSKTILFTSGVENKVPAAKRQAIAEYLTRANYGLNVGNFEMDFSDGEVRCRTSISVGDGQLTSEMVRCIVHVNLGLIDRYFPGIMAVIYTGTSPADAIAQVEYKSSLQNN